MKDFLAAPNISQMRFAMFYETWNLGFDPGRESTPVTFQMELHFDSDMVLFAKHYFHNRSYLRIDGRPVVFLYLTRTLTGDVAGMINGARTVLEAHGFNPFFIGDEIYWRVTPEDPNPAGPLLTTTPQANRIEQFDAITSYALYYGDPLPLLGPTNDFVGYPGTTDIVADERNLLTRTEPPPAARCRSSPTSRRASTTAGSGSRRTIRPNLANGWPVTARRPPSITSSAASRCPSSTPPCRSSW